MVLNIKKAKKDFEDGLLKGYSHMIVFYDVISQKQFSLYTFNNEEQEELIDSFCELDTFRLITVFDYTLNFDFQVKSLLKENNEKTLKLIMYK